MSYIPHFGHGLHRLLYRSRCNIPLARLDAEVDAVVEASARRNAARSVTGALLYCDGQFLQALEGGRDSVVLLYEAIAKDPRHSDIRIVSVQEIETRAFGRWGMKRGKTGAGDRMDLAAMSGEDLFQILRLSALLRTKTGRILAAAPPA